MGWVGLAVALVLWGFWVGLVWGSEVVSNLPTSTKASDPNPNPRMSPMQPTPYGLAKNRPCLLQPQTSNINRTKKEKEKKGETKQTPGTSITLKECGHYPRNGNIDPFLKGHGDFNYSFCGFGRKSTRKTAHFGRYLGRFAVTSSQCCPVTRRVELGILAFQFGVTRFRRARDVDPDPSSHFLSSHFTHH